MKRYIGLFFITYFITPASNGQCNLPATLTSSLDSTNCVFSFSIYASGTSPYTYYWDFGGGVVSIDQNPYFNLFTLVATPAAVSVDVSDAMGCDTSITFNIDYVDCPGSLTVCYTDFSAQPITCDQIWFMPIITESTSEYNWDFGDGVTSTSMTTLHTYADTGSYYVTLNMATAGGTVICPQISRTIQVCPPSCDLDGTIQYSNDSCFYSFSANPSGTHGPFVYAWDFGNGQTSTDENPQVDLLNGTNSISLTIADTLGCEVNLFEALMVICSYANIEENSLINVYPNPFNDNFTVDGQGEYSIEIYSVAGKLIQTILGENKTIISTVGMSSGIYYLKVTQASISSYESLIKL